jgi:hypothetical protein
MLNQDNANAAQYKGQYNDYQSQADAANKQVGNYTNYMANEGSAGNQYHNELAKQEGNLGYDQNQMTAARGNLNSATGALSAYNDFANTAASKWGMNAGGFAAANSGALGGLNNNIASNQNVVNGLSDIYKTAQTGANQFTGQVVQGEQNTLAGYQQQFSNAASQRDSAASQMQFWSNLASSQGSLNSQQQAAYAQASASYAAAQNSLASASYAIAQARNLNQTTDFDKQTHDRQAADIAARQQQQQQQAQHAQQQAQAAHNQYYNVDTSNAANFLGSVGSSAINGLSSGANWLFGGLGAHSNLIKNG